MSISTDLLGSDLTRHPQTQSAVCWECGELTDCIEYVVCCTGTLFHICPPCEASIQSTGEEGSPPTCATQSANSAKKAEPEQSDSTCRSKIP